MILENRHTNLLRCFGHKTVEKFVHKLLNFDQKHRVDNRNCSKTVVTKHGFMDMPLKLRLDRLNGSFLKSQDREKIAKISKVKSFSLFPFYFNGVVHHELYSCMVVLLLGKLCIFCENAQIVA